MDLPKTLERFRNKIDDFADECESGDGFWVYLKPGWFSPMSETHIIHENTIAECVRELCYIVPCECEDCTNP